ncbi:MAG: HEAT repeat domain-containing protein [Deltaproteobacteria bacterium]|nr:HEAT repeat domain-containing protein [Deltaproteobacteria bacterium]
MKPFVRSAFAIVALVALLASAICLADGRTDYLTRMLRESSQFRVRVQAALTLGEIGDHATVPVLVGALEDEEPAVRIAALAALARIGDPSALEPVRARTRDRSADVKSQARTTLRTLQAIAQRAGTPSPAPPVPAEQARFYIGLGGMGNRAGVRGDEAKRLLRQYLQAEVGATAAVVVTPDDESPAVTSKVLKQRRLTGYWIDGSITKLARENGVVRADISLMVMTNPGRDLRMMLSGSASVSSSGQTTPAVETELQNQALKGAATGVVRRLLTQLSTTVGSEAP